MICQLILSHIKKSYTHEGRCYDVLSDLSYTFERAKTYGLMGSSGAGKSTLLHILAGLDSPTSGSVVVDGTQQQFLQRLGILFQLPYLINELSVLENVVLKGLIEKKSYAECKHDGILLLEKVGLGHKQNCFPAMLSGGEQQRVALARALFNKPDFVLADEPTSNLDQITGTKIIELLHACQQEWQFGLIVCSHDQYVLESMQTILKLEHGKLHDYKKNVILQSSSGQRFNTAQ